MKMFKVAVRLRECGATAAMVVERESLEWVNES